MKTLLIVFYLFPIFSIDHDFHDNKDAIIGKWISFEDKNLEVEVYKYGNEYRAKIIWFDDSDDKDIPMLVRCDSKNPEKELRNRKIIGLEVLHSLIYNTEKDDWEEGKIYDASSGREWSATLWIKKDGLLNVRGFWHFEFIGHNIRFKRVL